MSNTRKYDTALLPDRPRSVLRNLLALIPPLVLLAPPVANARIDLSTAPPNTRTGSGPTLSLGRVGLDPCPDGYCRPEPNGNLFYFLTPHSRPIEPVPGVILRIPLGSGGR